MWKKIGIESKKEINLYTQNRFDICDFSFTNLLLWSKGENLEYKIEDNVLVIRGYYEGEKYYFMPIPKEETEENILHMRKEIDMIREEKAPIGYFSEYWKEKLKPHYSFLEERDSFDYVYQTKDLAFLKGRKFSKKKNRISQFKRRYPNFIFEEITEDNLEAVKSFQKKWCYCRECEKEEILRNENLGIMTLLDSFHDLDVFGAMLKVNDEIIGFSIGEILNSQYIVVHIEKAISDFIGSYQILNSLFLQKYGEGYEYVNREDDFGNEGLRDAKTSYHPIFLLKKYSILN